jgi:hypothetical protein
MSVHDPLTEASHLCILAAAAGQLRLFQRLRNVGRQRRGQNLPFLQPLRQSPCDLTPVAVGQRLRFRASQRIWR